MAEITAMPPYFDSLIFQGCSQWNHSLKWPKSYVHVFFRYHI